MPAIWCSHSHHVHMAHPACSGLILTLSWWTSAEFGSPLRQYRHKGQEHYFCKDFFLEFLIVLSTFPLRVRCPRYMQMELLSAAAHMRTGREDNLCDSCVDTTQACLIFEPIQSVNSIFPLNTASLHLNARGSPLWRDPIYLWSGGFETESLFILTSCYVTLTSSFFLLFPTWSPGNNIVSEQSNKTKE